MKKVIIIPFVWMLFYTASAQTEWTTLGSNIYNTNSGNVGIGTNTPGEKLTVVGNVKLSGGIYWDWPNRIIEQYADPDGESRTIRFRNSMNAANGNPKGGFDFADHLGTSILRIINNNVGIGTNSPTEKLTVAGNVKLNGAIYWDWANRAIEQYADPDGESQTIRFRNSMNAANGNPKGGFDFTDHLGNSVMRIINNAVGIGTVNPGSFKLAVEGKIGAREVRVTNANPWPDYVFNNQYKLISLTSLEEYIRKNNRLPNIPSPQEVKENGIELGQMNAKLLEKIEELTLYVIDLKKEIEQLKKERR